MEEGGLHHRSRPDIEGEGREHRRDGEPLRHGATGYRRRPHPGRAGRGGTGEHAPDAGRTDPGAHQRVPRRRTCRPRGAGLRRRAARGPGRGPRSPPRRDQLGCRLLRLDRGRGLGRHPHGLRGRRRSSGRRDEGCDHRGPGGYSAPEPGPADRRHRRRGPAGRGRLRLLLRGWLRRGSDVPIRRRPPGLRGVAVGDRRRHRRGHRGRGRRGTVRRVEHTQQLPAWPVAGGNLTGTGIVALLLLLAITLLGAVVGGAAGMRYHRKLETSEAEYLE